jgi:hypothetical protein
MPTPAERQALIFLAAVAALGVGVNSWRAVSAEPVVAGSQGDLAAQIARVDSVVASSPARDAKVGQSRQGRVRRGTYTLGLPTPPPSPPSARPPRAASPADGRRAPAAMRPIDVDTASAALIETLPRIGPKLSERIVANRDSFGPFGSLEGLGRVKGIGPAMSRALSDLVVFSGVPRLGAPTAGTKGRRGRPMP